MANQLQVGGIAKLTDGVLMSEQKPVSSLKSHFEGLHLHQPTANVVEPQRSPRVTKPQDKLRPVTPSSAIRASLDLPRPNSPWSSTHDARSDAERTTRLGTMDGKLPPDTNHKRPLSTLIHAAPQITPSVLVESPRSPPKGDFFQRDGSRSPEKSTDFTTIGKVRHLVSQHSSRDSTRPSTPRVPSADAVPTQAGKERGSSKPPPPTVNRADKPKIPAKSSQLVAQDLSTLVPNIRKVSNASAVSPFSTPPSSDECPSPERTPSISINPKVVSQNLSEITGATVARSLQQQTPPVVQERPSDARSWGFAKPPIPAERKDPRPSGFSAGGFQAPISGASVVPARANTVSERSPSRDSRAPAPPPARSGTRHVSENIRHLSPSRNTENLSSERHTATRDARQWGFSKVGIANAADASGDYRPGLPPRRQEMEAPPRPAEDLKRPHANVSNRSSPPVSHDDRQNAPVPERSRSRVPPPAGATFLPPPKRHTFTESQPTAEPLVTSLPSNDDVDSDEAENVVQEPVSVRTDYPDATQTNRRPPYFRSGVQSLPTKTDPRIFDMCGQYLCTAGYVTRVFDLTTGEVIMALNHGETVKVLAVAFKPAQGLDNEAQRLWIGNNVGELQEIDIATHSYTVSSMAHNRCEIVRILRHRKDMWTLDIEGKLLVWPADETGMPSLKNSHISHRVQKGHTFSMAVRDQLWLASGKEVRVYKPGNETSVAAVTKPLQQSGTGEITSGTYTAQAGGRAYFGHTDGKVTIYSTKDYTCVSIVKASDYKITGLAFAGDLLWAAYKTGKVYVYDTSVTPWKVKKDWTAHNGPASGMLLDPSSVWALQRLQVVTVGHDNHARFWDGMLEEDWLETAMEENDTEYCNFREVHAAVVTWNIGAVHPSDVGGDFISDAIHVEEPPEILAFGFQEVVDLENGAVTAKSIFGFGKKKDAMQAEQHQSRVYRDWRDHLHKIVNRHTSAGFSYGELHMSSLVGLFQCIFVRQDQRRAVSNVCAADVKCGMKGRYGNKGALVTRFVLDDTSLCFINCHLAAGQTHTSHRNNDVATILEASSLAPEDDLSSRSSLFIGGGDGTQILDHEICILNGDLNYRIDTMTRDTVLNLLKRQDMAKLLERDQLLLCRRRMSGFRLSPFSEMPLTFAPTYKYDVDSDAYDTSDKKRAPAWCDRLLYRGTPGRIQQLEYRRHEVRVSDHRPVSGLFRIRVKTVDVAKRNATRERCETAFARVKRKMAEQAGVEYLVNSLGLGESEAKAALAGS